MSLRVYRIQRGVSLGMFSDRGNDRHHGHYAKCETGFLFLPMATVCVCVTLCVIKARKTFASFVSRLTYPPLLVVIVFNKETRDQLSPAATIFSRFQLNRCPPETIVSGEDRWQKSDDF